MKWTASSQSRQIMRYAQLVKYPLRMVKLYNSFFSLVVSFLGNKLLPSNVHWHEYLMKVTCYRLWVPWQGYGFFLSSKLNFHILRHEKKSKRGFMYRVDWGN